MDVAITWVCLGGGAVMIIVSVVIISWVQARTGDGEASRPKSERDD